MQVRGNLREGADPAGLATATTASLQGGLLLCQVRRDPRAAEVIDDKVDDVAGRPDRYDVVFDVAATRPLADMIRILVPGGRYVLAGAAKGGLFAIVRRLTGVQLRSRLLNHRTVNYLARVKADDLAVLSQLVGAGQLRPVIDRTYPLSETMEAVRFVGTGEARDKVVISVA